MQVSDGSSIRRAFALFAVYNVGASLWRAPVHIVIAAIIFMILAASPRLPKANPR